ncbi:MAG: PAS domain-containing protein [Cytophagales bacterium]|nr:PAS domain-containing protein [Bernardetiaceae bacterium]MDW8204317.1 PAS domain-containing protein [Cytophagales bacterium]
MDSAINGHITHRQQLQEHCNIFDTTNQSALDRLTQMAALICQTPIALISFLSQERQWLKSKVGINIDSTPIEHAFCTYAIRQPDIFEVENATKDVRFANNPFVVGEPQIRFYAGQPLIDANGTALGTLCVIDKQLRQLNDYQRQMLRLLAQQAVEVLSLQAQKQLSEAFFELAPQMLCIVRADGLLVRVNSEWENVLQYAAEKLIGNSIFSFIHPADIASTQGALDALNNGEAIRGFVNRYRCADGSYRSIQWNARKTDGLIFASGKDITAELNATERMRQSEERYRMVTELVSDYVYNLKIEGEHIEIEWASDNIERILGYSLKELQQPGMWQSIVHPDDQCKLTLHAQRLHQQAESCKEYRVKTKAGKWIWVRDHNRVISIASDTVGYVIGATKDITKEKEAEIALLHAKDLLEQTGKAARIGTWELDVINLHLTWSSVTCMIHEVAADFQPTLESAIAFYKEGESRQQISDAVQKAIEQGIPFDLTLELQTANQHLIWVRAIGIPEWQNGRCVRLYGAFQDIDKQKRIQLALQQQQKVLSERNRQLEQLIQLSERQNEQLKEYTYITSHNLRAAVANMLSLTDLLLSTPHDEQLLGMLHQAARRLDNVIAKMNQLLDVSLAMHQQKQPVNVLATVQENLAFLHSQYTEHVQVSLQMPTTLTILVIPAYLDSILYNLLSNAIKYSRPDTPCQITIKAYEKSEWVVIEVIDNGIGIDLQQHRDKLFRIGNRLSSQQEGKGLGLYLTMQQVEAMGGSIEVESQVGKGSVFRIYLPKT